jgi:TolB-like protein/tetratricopeptide (TPR) repeat protein
LAEAGIGRIEALWGKLQRRKVVQWGVAYGLFAWGLLQGLEYLTDTFGWPPPLQQLATLTSLIGLPIVLVVAWYHGDRGEQQVTPAEFLILFGLLLLGGALFWWFGKSSISTTTHRDGAGETTPAPAPDRSIAVLPFDNLSGDPANGYLGDGLAEELANLLTRVPDLEVASRTSAFSFKGLKMTICEIAAELGVKYLVEGSLRRNGDTLAITAQLVECPRGTHAWSNTYRRPIEDLPSVEDDIAGSVVEALKIVLAPETLKRMQRRGAVDRGAYEAYLQGVSELRNFTDATSLDRAVQRFREAATIDPTYAEAYAGRCESHVQRFMKVRAVQDVADAASACAQAARLDSGLPEVHAALGMLYVATGQHELAEREYRRAIELDPDDVEAHLGLGRALKLQGQPEAADRSFQQAIQLRPRYWRVYDAYGGFLFEQGRPREAIAQYRRGVELAPRNAQLLSNLGGVLFMHGDFDAAADAFRQSVEIAPTSEGYSNTGTNHYYAARYEDAVAMFEQASRLAPEDYQIWGNLGDAYRRASGKGDLANRAYARAAELARAGLGVNPDSTGARTQLAYFLVRQGQHAQAAAELETAGSVPIGDLNSHYYSALVYKELGRAADAVAETLKLLEGGYPAALLVADPEFAEIVRDPAVSAAIEEAGNAAPQQSIH